MPNIDVTKAAMWEDTGCQYMARIVGNDAAYITQAAITAITRKIYQLPDRTLVATDSLVVANVVYDSLQTDARWTKDSTGYNFRDPLDAADFASGDALYRIEYLFDPVSGQNFADVFQLHARELFGS